MRLLHARQRPVQMFDPFQQIMCSSNRRSEININANDERHQDVDHGDIHLTTTLQHTADWKRQIPHMRQPTTSALYSSQTSMLLDQLPLRAQTSTPKTPFFSPSDVSQRIIQLQEHSLIPEQKSSLNHHPLQAEASTLTTPFFSPNNNSPRMMQSIEHHHDRMSMNRTKMNVQSSRMQQQQLLLQKLLSRRKKETTHQAVMR
jgi:hypothetical protein